MKNFLHAITSFSSGRKTAKFVVLIWILVAVLLSVVAPASKDYKVNINGSGLPADAKSEIALKKAQQYFKEDGGAVALLVFTQKEGITAESKMEIGKLLDTFTNSKDYPFVKEVIPFKSFPKAVQDSFLSEDQTTIALPVRLKENLEMDDIHSTIEKFAKSGKAELPSELQLYITGPAGIAADTLELFSKADLVLLFSTVGIILVLLMLIYRSPLLALIPLIICGIVYMIVDKVLGLAGKHGIFALDAQSLSIMMILLFAALTDYSLFVFSRYREELKMNDDKFISMKKAMQGVGEPILFSSGTVLAAMFILFIAIYKPYQSFAPVFVVAMFIILLAGMTLIPAFFTLFGRKAFWPSIPKVGQDLSEHKGLWARVAKMVTKKPYISGGIVLLLLVLSAINMTQINYSFNLIRSFPEELQSRQGFELLESKFSKGELAPTDVVLVVDKKGAITKENVASLEKELANQVGVDEVHVQVNHQNFANVRNNKNPYEEQKAVKLRLTFEENPYEQKSLDALQLLRKNEEEVLEKSGFDVDHTALYFSGETAKQADVRDVNNRDTLLIVIFVTILILILLVVQTRSLVAPLYMMATILISYTSAMGISNFAFEHFFGYSEMSYRIPLYAFVFLVALGVDYNIMLMSRIQEELLHHDLKTAVQRGVALTGGVISSAGLILAATFSVLMTQPILELFMFGFVVFIGILIDTFIVRGVLVPAIILAIGKWNFWPRKM